VQADYERNYMAMRKKKKTENLSGIFISVVAKTTKCGKRVIGFSQQRTNCKLPTPTQQATLFYVEATDSTNLGGKQI
jgi:hypothetical protein